MLQALVRWAGSGHVYAVYSGGYKRWVPDVATLEATVALASLGGVELIIQDIEAVAIFRAFGPVAAPTPEGVDVYGIPV